MLAFFWGPEYNYKYIGTDLEMEDWYNVGQQVVVCPKYRGGGDANTSIWVSI